jgi:hypothetical protein
MNDPLMIHLLYGTAIRQRNSEGVTVLLCGCAHDDTTWLQMCDADYQDWHVRHVEAQKQHDIESLI